jgi:hypothetical protein
VLLLIAGCAQWQSVPVSEVRARPLPRWVQVTTRDSVHYTLQRARVVPGDTLVGNSADAGQGESDVRLPLAAIARLDARVPSGAGSIGVGVLVVAGVAGLVALIGHAAAR